AVEREIQPPNLRMSLAAAPSQRNRTAWCVIKWLPAAYTTAAARLLTTKAHAEGHAKAHKIPTTKPAPSAAMASSVILRSWRCRFGVQALVLVKPRMPSEDAATISSGKISGCR